MRLAHSRQEQHKSEDGAIAIIAAVCALLLFGIAALVVDLGLQRDTRREAQTAADASALAAANRLYLNGTPDLVNAALVAKNYAWTNFRVPLTAWATCTDNTPLAVPSASTQCISFDSATNPLKVRVVLPTRQIDASFTGATGVSRIDVAASARAALVPGLGAGCTICVIGAGTDVGNLDVRAQGGGSIYVNGTLGSGPHGVLKSEGGGTLTVHSPSIPSNLTISTPVVTNAPNMPDPFDDSIYPTVPNTAVSSGGNICSGGPGIYMNPTATGAGCTNLQTGLYVIVGGTLNFGALKTGVNGATFYFTCNSRTGSTYRARMCSTEDGADFDLNGNASTVLNAPPPGVTTAGDIPGMLVLFDKTNTASMRLNGTVQPTMSGTLYMPAATFDVRGTADVRFTGQLIVGNLTGNGNGTLYVTASASLASTKPGTPALDR
ncbi:pilus assembly protein TadG-related protein [Nocardioides marmorisolisilvae]|uniref:Putative Flp pilus-assembly TadG-like N-terminal domain-containing protein n=1 Tax=Nocardioides marmorisolisilvae TaxID=1542737 RepID=A0A3N0DWM2_9ACTN|nr:pilus assembly protein TadG-related protein [Nocardioides marmorisolisilvae]RNL79843.1 hypothetical protein EFL95_12920 [Nocardioides marmorisolisilvae]